MQLFQYTTGAKSIGRMLLDHARQFYLQSQLFFKQISILLMIRVLKNGKKERYVSLPDFPSRFLFQRKTHYKPYSPRRWTSPFRFRYLNDSIPVRQQSIHQIPKRHPRLFQAVVSCGVFLGPMYDVRRWRHLHRVKPHKVSKMKI